MTVPLTIHEHATPGGTATLRIRGEVDLASADRLRQATIDAMSRYRAVRLDLSGAYFFDASGLRALHAIHREAVRRRQPVPTLLGVRPLLAKMLKLTGLTRHFPLEPAHVRSPAAIAA
jgi:anti-anti-sigma factor